MSFDTSESKTLLALKYQQMYYLVRILRVLSLRDLCSAIANKRLLSEAMHYLCLCTAGLRKPFIQILKEWPMVLSDSHRGYLFSFSEAQQSSAPSCNL